MMNKIEDALHKAWMAAMRLTGTSRQADEARDDLAWYIYTGRASTGFVKTVCNLKGVQYRVIARRLTDNATCRGRAVKATRDYVNGVMARDYIDSIATFAENK